MEDGETGEREIFSRLLVEGGVARRGLEKAMAHFAFFVHGDAEFRGLWRFAAGSGELHFDALNGAERFEFGRESQSCR